MNKLLVILFCFISFNSFSAEYEVSLLGFEDWSVYNDYREYAINDKGVIVGTATNRKTNQKIMFTYDPKAGFNEIEAKENNLQPLKINNAGQIIGHGSKPFIWSKSLGVRWIEIPNSKSSKVSDLNDLGQVIGNYGDSNGRPRPFLWDYGVITDMGPGSDFALQIEALGYHVMSVELISINNKGEFVGTFDYGKYNERTKKYVTVGKALFFWNGDVYIIPIKSTKLGELGVNLLTLNNKSEVMFYLYYLGEDETYNTFYWNLEEGLTEISEFIGHKMNDSSIILGMTNNYTPAIWKKGKIVTLAELLGVENIKNISPQYSDDYSIEKLENFIDINNKGQIICNAIIWADSYPCILSPIVDHKKMPEGWDEFLQEYDSSEKKKERY